MSSGEQPFGSSLAKGDDISNFMNIVYICDPTNERLPDKEIIYSLKKKGKVKVLDVRRIDLKRSIKCVLNCDFVLFHGEMGKFDRATYLFVLDRLRVLLEGTKAKKVLWLLDKIWGERFDLLLYFHDVVDYIFVSDETWAKRFASDKVFVLHPAASERKIAGKFRKEMACDIALFGEVTPERENELKFLRDKFGGRLKVFNNKFGKDLADLCKSAKVIISPRSPFDDFFWSDRIYKVLSYGGCCVHPRTYGLREQGFIDGTHYVDYYMEQELFVTIQVLLDKRSDKRRKKMGQDGRKFVMENHTYSQRIDEILTKIKQDENKNIVVGDPIQKEGGGNLEA